MSLSNFPTTETMHELRKSSANGDQLQVNLSISSQSVPSYGNNQSEMLHLDTQFSKQTSCGSGKRRRRILPTPLRIPLQHLWSFRRLRKQRKKSMKSQSSSEDKENSMNVVDQDFDIVSESSCQKHFSERAALTCSICFLELESHKFPKLIMCNHRCCSDCLESYLQTEIQESRINITCPECPKMMHPNDIGLILNDKSILEKYEIFMVRRHLTCEPDTRWCPAIDCNYGVIAAGCASCPKLKCERPGCDSYFCYHCRQIWHPNKTCDDARVERASSVLKASISQEIQSSDTKACPRCNALIAKMEDGSCNHMTCTICGAEFCWLCMKQISDLHYLSPSGCTFWGKKPWSRKKKVLWQIGTLIGAPLGIALIAGLTIPAMIIGIPIYTGRKLYKKYKGQVSDRRRNLIVIAGVTTSIFVAPILAAVTVSVGVPILLAYVYGVVPISLCRTGGCGITKTENGVRLDVDEQQGETTASFNNRIVDIDMIANGGSLNNSNDKNRQSSANSLTSTATVSVNDSSGWYLQKEGVETDSRRSINIRKLSILSENDTEDGVGDSKIGNNISASVVHIERENDCVSNTAIAGESLTGSICGSTGYNPNVKFRKNSIGSDSMNYSLCDNVSNITYPESLAGTIIDTSSSAPSSSTTTNQNQQPQAASFDNNNVAPACGMVPTMAAPLILESNLNCQSNKASSKDPIKSATMTTLLGPKNLATPRNSAKPSNFGAKCNKQLFTVYKKNGTDNATTGVAAIATSTTRPRKKNGLQFVHQSPQTPISVSIATPSLCPSIQTSCDNNTASASTASVNEKNAASSFSHLTKFSTNSDDGDFDEDLESKKLIKKSGSDVFLNNDEEEKDALRSCSIDHHDLLGSVVDKQSVPTCFSLNCRRESGGSGDSDQSVKKTETPIYEQCNNTTTEGIETMHELDSSELKSRHLSQLSSTMTTSNDDDTSSSVKLTQPLLQSE